MDATYTRRLLEELGYAVACRRQGWTECLVWCPGERWLGRGRDEGEALADALAQMLPSRAGTRLYEWWVRSRTGEHAEPSRADAETAITEPSPEERLYTRAEALEALHLLADRIDGERAELGLMAPLRQRMVMLAWICRARTWEDRRPGDSFVARQVAAIARKITNLGKLWWPGSVRSLHVHSTPLDAASEAGFEGGWPPRNWAEAAELVDRRLHDIFARDEAMGRDEYGWADVQQLTPTPAEPDKLLTDLTQGLASMAGSLDDPPRSSLKHSLPTTSADVARYLGWGRQIRWLRNAVSDFEAWGTAVGRLRWVALQLGSKGTELCDVLDPDHRSKAPWAEAVAAGGRPALTAHAATAPRAGAALIDQVRDRTSGLRALFVASEADAEFKEQLEKILGLSISVCDSSPVRIQSETKKIEQGSYDLTLSATGFRRFVADAPLSSACRRANIPYVRVYRGRTLACARGIAREMGIPLN